MVTIEPQAFHLISTKILKGYVQPTTESFWQYIFPSFTVLSEKIFGTLHWLFLKIDKWKKTVDNKKVFSAILTDLSKAFDWIYHDLLIAKWHANGLSLPALKMIQECLLDRKTKNKNSIFIQYMGENYFCFCLRICLRISLVQCPFM